MYFLNDGTRNFTKKKFDKCLSCMYHFNVSGFCPKTYQRLKLTKLVNELIRVRLLPSHKDWEPAASLQVLARANSTSLW